MTATRTHSGATVAFKDGDDNALTNPVTLAVGANVIKAVVTAEDTTTIKTYMVTVTREATTTVCPAPDLAGRAQIWTGTVTVGALDIFDTIFRYGFGSGAGAGMLSDTTFDVGINSYTIDHATVGTGTSPAIPAESLTFSLSDSGLTDADRAALTLHVCGDAFAFSAATYTSEEGDLIDSGHDYEWEDTGLDWSSVTTRTLYLSVRTNSPATGTPTITGTPRVGATLTASTANISDDDGKPSVFEYQWFRVDGSNRTNVGADQRTYTVTDADVGSQIQVEVTFTDDAGNEEGPLTSARTDTVTATTAPPPPTGQSDKQLIWTSPSTCSCPDENVTATQILAQKFSTGSDKGGYRVRSLWVYTSDTAIGRNAARFSLWSAGSDGNPGVEVFAWDFDHWNNSEVLFLTAPDGPATKLDPNTTYFIVAKANGNNTIEIQASRNRDRRQGGGWNIEGRHLESSDSGSSWSSHGKPITFRLRGIVRLSPVRLDALTVTGTQIDPTLKGYTYEGEIPFGTDTVTIDAQPGDTTSTLEYLFPDGSTVHDDTTQSGLQVSPITDRTRVNIKITSADNVWSETYKVRLRRMGNPVQAPATGTISVAGDAVVGGTLEASVRNFNDPNGTFFAEGGRPWHGPDFIRRNYGFHFVWYADRSTSGNTQYIVGQGRQLELTQNMRGRQISVKYAFTDDLDNDESLSSPETGAVRAQPGTSTATTATDEEGAAPLTAQFAAMPAEHDGESKFRFRLVFSDDIFDGTEPLNKNKAVRDALAVTGGVATGSRRVDKTEFDEYWIMVKPSGNGPVTISLSPASSCSTSSVTCTPDGRKLTTPISTRVEGPPGLSVADAEVHEGPGAILEFGVKLSREPSSTVTVEYSTSDGTAQAGADYTAANGTVVFAAGETRKTVEVTVLDDAHDEGSETLTLVLSTPSGAYLADGEATGTIENADPLQQAWLARFGRTVGTHVTDAVSARFFGGGAAASHVTVGGYRLPLGRGHAGRSTSIPSPLAGEGRVRGAPSGSTAAAADSTDRDPTTAVLEEVARVLGLGSGGGAPTDPDSDAGVRWDPRLGQSRTLDVGQTVDLRRLLLGSSFRLSLGADGVDSSRPRLTAWGRVAGTTFDGQDGALTLDGDVLTGTVGVDGEWDRVLLGVAVAHSRGDGSFASLHLEDRGQGDLEQTLTSIHPYLRYAVTDRLDVWGLVGYGWGELEVEMANGDRLETDTALVMGAFGGRGILLAPADTGGFQLATRTDAMLTRTSADAAANTAETAADAHRVRVVLEGSRGVTWADGRTFTPTVELGVRHDWGDAETGFGLELGGRVQYADPNQGLTMEAAVRGLLAHEDSDYQEWGASGTIRIDPGPMGQGLALTLSPTWGTTQSGVDGLWNRQTTAGLAPQSNRRAPSGQLNAELGYGVTAFGTGLLTPYAGTVLTDGADRTYRLGTRWTAVSGLTLALEGHRQEPAGDQPVNQGLRLQVGWGF